MSTDCKFCQLASAPDSTVRGSVYVLPDGYPVTPGHRLIIPVQHRSDYFELTFEELQDTHKALEGLRADLLADGAEGFNIGWTDFASEETQTNMYCIRKRNFVSVFLFPLLNDYGLCNHLAEVVHDEFCKNFLGK